jgi:hypothetical protein
MVLNVNGLNVLVSMRNVTKCKRHRRNPLLKGIKRRLITSKVTLNGQSHIMNLSSNGRSIPLT